MVTPEELSQFSIFQDLTDGEKQIVARYLKRKGLKQVRRYSLMVKMAASYIW